MSELKLRNSKKTPPLEGTSQGLNDDGLHQIKGKNLWINGTATTTQKQVRICHPALSNDSSFSKLVNDASTTTTSQLLVPQIIQSIIGASALFLVFTNLYLLEKYKRFRLVMTKRSWLYLKIFGQLSFSYWNWIFMLASIFVINLLTVLLILYDMRQIAKHGRHRVNKNLLLQLVLCGGWLTAPVIVFFTKYPYLNGYETSQSMVRLTQLIGLSVTLFGALIILVDKTNLI